MQTYRVTRPLNILYIDGASAALTFSGTVDSQDVLLHGKVTSLHWRVLYDEVTRAHELCT